MNEERDGQNFDDDVWDPDEFIVDNDSEDEDVEDVRNNPLRLTQIAGEEIRRLWTSNHYCPSDDEIFTVMTFVKRGLLQNEIKNIQQRWKLLISFNPTLPQIARAALLAHHGLLGTVRDIHLPDVDLSSVPAEHLTSLASCLTENVLINNIRGWSLVSFLDGLKCKHLRISCRSLGSAEAKAIVRAAESRVENVVLEKGVTLDDLSSLPDIAWFANLAHEGLLGSVREIYLQDIDLSSVPVEHLASLASCVTELVHISNVKGCDLVTFLDALRCRKLIMRCQTLTIAEKEALRSLRDVDDLVTNNVQYDNGGTKYPLPFLPRHPEPGHPGQPDQAPEARGAAHHGPGPGPGPDLPDIQPHAVRPQRLRHAAFLFDYYYGVKMDDEKLELTQDSPEIKKKGKY